jgi:hypothetical protein
MTNSDIITILTAITGILVSYYFFRQAQKNKEPCWAVKSNNLIRDFGSNISKLEIVYDRQKIENLTISRVMFWNNGSETLERQHIVSANPLKILGINGAKIIDAEVLKQNNHHCNFSITKSNDQLCAYIDFDYLDKNHGAVLQIMHTGLSSRDITVEGSVKGVNKIYSKNIETVWLPLTPKKFDRKFSPLMRRRISIFLNFSLSAIVLAMGFTILSRSTPRTPDYEKTILVFQVIFMMTFLVARIVNVYKSTPPKGLEIFEDELTI